MYLPKTSGVFPAKKNPKPTNPTCLTSATLFKQWKLLWVYERNQTAEVSALNSLLKVSSPILLISFSCNYPVPILIWGGKKKKVSYMIWKPNIHSPSTAELQRGGVSIDEVGVLSTPFEYLMRGKKNRNISGPWGFLYAKTTGDQLLGGIFWCGRVLFFSSRGRRKG